MYIHNHYMTVKTKISEKMLIKLTREPKGKPISRHQESTEQSLVNTSLQKLSQRPVQSE